MKSASRFRRFRNWLQDRFGADSAKEINKEINRVDEELGKLEKNLNREKNPDEKRKIQHRIEELTGKRSKLSVRLKNG